LKCANFLAETIEHEGRDSVAAFIAEPVQGSAGMIIPPPEYWPRVREICSEMGVLLIADEVMSGFGRTGKLFAVENWGVIPDIMTMAKGITSGYIPFGAVAIGEEIYQELKSRQTPFSHGFTYSGHAVGAAAKSWRTTRPGWDNMLLGGCRRSFCLSRRSGTLMAWA
jgi:putrescine aminotransferase